MTSKEDIDEYNNKVRAHNDLIKTFERLGLVYDRNNCIMFFMPEGDQVMF